MAGDKYLYDNSGVLTEKAAIQASAGAGDAGKVPALDATGKLDTTMMPVGIGAETDSIATSQTLVAGDFVNIWDSTGLKVRKADASVAGKEAHGFVLAAHTHPTTAVVYRPSQSNNQKTGMTIGAMQFLSVTFPGGTQEICPTGTGQAIQKLGIALSATQMTFAPQEHIILL